MSQLKKIIQPPFLQAGDKVALVSPAYWVPQEAIQMAAETIKGWGLQPVIGPHTNNLNVNAYAGTADERAADLLWALEDDSIKAMLCSRGGYGSIHLLNRIPQETYRQHPKWFIGHAEGVLVGGNLSSYCAIAGTKFSLSPKQDVILFIEEVEESLHSIDRLFYMLSLQQNFERVKGIILGTFNSIKYDLQYGSVEQMLIAHLHDYEIPVCCGFPVGSSSCIPLIEGAPCTLDVAADQSVLTFNVRGERKRVEVNVTGSALFKESDL